MKLVVVEHDVLVEVSQPVSTEVVETCPRPGGRGLRVAASAGRLRVRLLRAWKPSTSANSGPPADAPCGMKDRVRSSSPGSIIIAPPSEAQRQPRDHRLHAAGEDDSSHPEATFCPRRSTASRTPTRARKAVLSWHAGGTLSGKPAFHRRGLGDVGRPWIAERAEHRKPSTTSSTRFRIERPRCG